MSESSKLNVTLNKMPFSDGDGTFSGQFESKELLQLLKLSTELAADEVFWMKSNSEIIYVNQAACDKLGYAKEELIGMSVWEWDPLFPKNVWPAFWAELKEKRYIDFETQHQHRDGHVFSVRIRGHLVEQSGEELLFAYVSDISDLKRHELEMQTNSQQMKALLDQEKKKFAEFVNLAPIGIAINRLEDGSFEYINDEFSRFTGYSIEELNAMDYWQLTPEKYQEQELKQLDDMAQKGSYGPYQKEYIHKKGHNYPVLLSGIKITDIEGKDFIWSVVQDISEQKAVEEQIRAAKASADASAFRMQLANDSAEIGVWEWDLQTNELVWDTWMYKLYGVDKNQFSGAYEAWEKSVHPEDLNPTIERLNLAISGEGRYDPEFRIIRPDGQVRTIKASAEVIRDDAGGALRVVGVNYDITDKVEAMATLERAKKEAEDAAGAKSDFLANMSHEIRTPMNAILGGLQLLKNAELEEELGVVLDNASFSAQSLLTIINDILDYSKIESNRLELENKAFSLREVMDSVRYDLDSLVSNKGIDFIVDFDESFEDGWLGDLVRVKQVVLNLASNAVKFTDKGSVELAVTTIERDGQPAIQMIVSDTGIGMSKQALATIYERFSQADSSTTRKYGGTGLGMSITTSLVRLMAGTIAIESEEGVGTKITVVLPLHKAELTEPEAKVKALTPPDLSAKRILIAEDNKINQVLIKSIMKATGADLTLVDNGKQAVVAIEQDLFDIVLMDIHMPEMDGLEAQRIIYQSKPELPVIALTANVMRDDVDGYIAQGFVAHIGKPIDMNSLYGVLSRFS